MSEKTKTRQFNPANKKGKTFILNNDEISLLKKITKANVIVVSDNTGSVEQLINSKAGIDTISFDAIVENMNFNKRAALMLKLLNSCGLDLIYQNQTISPIALGEWGKKHTQFIKFLQRARCIGESKVDSVDKV